MEGGEILAKRKNNIYKRKDGRFEARYVKERDEIGRIKKYGFIYGKTYNEAKIKREMILKKEKLKLNSNKKLFKNEINKWLNTKISIKNSSYYNYFVIVNSKIIPFFIKNTLNDINENLIINFYKSLKDNKLGSKRIKDILIVLKQFLEYEKIYIKFEMPKVKRKEIVTLQNNEIEIIEKKALKSNDIKTFSILLVLFSGLRIGELCALQWKDIDFENQVIHINKTLVRIKNDENHSKTKVIVDIPKTELSIRDVPIHKNILNQLKKFKKNDDYYVLTSSHTFITTQKYYIFYQKFLKKYNIKKYNFHALRHTFATRALLNGIDIKCLSEILGHSSVKITLDIYVHIKTQEKIDQINKLTFLTFKD